MGTVCPHLINMCIKNCQFFFTFPTKIDQSILECDYWQGCLDAILYCSQWSECDKILTGLFQPTYKEGTGIFVSGRNPPFPLKLWQNSSLDHNNSHFFRGIDWLMFFKATIDFNGFENIEPSRLDFFRAQQLVSVVFRWFSKFWGQRSTMVLRLTMVWMSHCTQKVPKINFQQNANFEQKT